MLQLLKSVLQLKYIITTIILIICGIPSIKVETYAEHVKDSTPEDGRQLRTKHVGALIDKYKVLCNKFVLNFISVL
jgi:hypothetical protein